MKIILGSESFPPNISGVAVATKNLAENFSKAGHEIYVFTPGPVYGARIDRKFQDYTVYRLRSIPNPFRKGYRITVFGNGWIKKILKKVQPDIIHLQDPAVIGTILRNLGHEFKIPVIITNHFSLEYALSYLKFTNSLIPFFKEKLVKYLVNFYNHCDLVITPTETFRTQVESWGVKTQVKAVSNGITVKEYTENFTEQELSELRTKFGLPKKPTVLYLGRIDKDKSIDVLIKAIPKVLKEIDAVFVFAGSGDQVLTMQEATKKLNIENSVKFIGPVNHDSKDFLKLYKNAQVFAIPSKIETQSLVTLEAMCSSLPVIAADAGALPELVHDGKNGYLFKPDDANDMAEKLIKLLKDKELGIKWGKASLDIAKNHNMKKTFARMEDIYREVITNKKALL